MLRPVVFTSTMEFLRPLLSSISLPFSEDVTIGDNLGSC